VTELLLIVRIDGRRVALRAAEVQSVIELETLAPVPLAAPHIAGLSALRSRVLTVVDCRRSLELRGGGQLPDRLEAAVVEHEAHYYALLVDGVEDVVESSTEPRPVTAGIGRGWDRVSRRMIEAGGELFLLIDIGSMIAGPELARAA
jgi:purine-binding chemotaxis protein CheW